MPPARIPLALFFLLGACHAPGFAPRIRPRERAFEVLREELAPAEGG